MWRQKDFDAALVGIARVGLDGRWLDLNPALCRLLGQRREAISKLRFQDVTHPDDLEQDVAEVERLLQRGEGSYSMIKRYLRPNGEAFWANLNVSLSLDRHGEPDYFVSVIQDFSSTKQELDRLQHAASHDKLTDLANRDRFEAALSESISFARRTGQGFALAFIDLDGFKEVNDTHGHLHGDDLLRQVAARLAGNIRKSDLAARIGGDEFAVLLNGVRSRNDLAQALSHVHHCFERPFLVAGNPIHLGASIGAACYPRDGEGMALLMHHADQEMYAAKRRQATEIDARARAARLILPGGGDEGRALASTAAPLSPPE